MTVFLILTAIAYGIVSTGGYILLVVKGYQGCPYSGKTMTTCPIYTVPAGDTRDASFSDASGSVSLIAEKVIQQHPQPGQPAQATPSGSGRISTCGRYVRPHSAGWPAGCQSGGSAPGRRWFRVPWGAASLLR